MKITDDQIKQIGKVLNDESRPLKERFRALFTLRNIGGNLAINLIKESFNDPSALLKHELAYCLGQMQDEEAINILISVLKDNNQEPMVRHEAAEALGAIGSNKALSILEEHRSDKTPEVAETCELAIERINWLNNEYPEEKHKLSYNPYNSVDPAPPALITDIKELKDILIDEKQSLFKRYRAMFALRNINNKESVEALGQALTCGSALFKHEIAFVLGQIQSTVGIPYLISSLENSDENEMVRHECAEALGSIATEDCTKVLEKFLDDEKRVVKESCVIADRKSVV